MRRSSAWASFSVLSLACAGTERSAAPPPEPVKRVETPATAASYEPASTSVVAEPQKREGAAGSTIGTIACGTTRCRSGSEVCTMSGSSWICVPSASKANGYYACDDASDCKAPLTCCVSFASAEEIYDCAEASADCAALPCAEPDGTTCPKGLRCEGGVCMADWRATCADSKQCPKDAPYCAWSSEPACIRDSSALSSLGDEGSTVAGLYQCTKPSDCGGLHECCTSMVYAEKATLCSHACDVANSALVCERDADCKDRALSWCGEDAQCRRAVRCRASNHPESHVLPPWLKTCQQLDY
jgi:hypothetical protein